MDKRADASYIRLPLKIDSLVEDLARKEGRGKNEMIIHLIARGIHLSSFNIQEYSFTDCLELQGKNRNEK